MLITVAMTTSALVVAYVVITGRKGDAIQLSEPRASLPIVAIQIICGNCSGDSERPIKTLVDRFGRCAHCGGSSYTLASKQGVSVEAARAARRYGEASRTYLSARDWNDASRFAQRVRSAA
jgi:hypothetical protein